MLFREFSFELGKVDFFVAIISLDELSHNGLDAIKLFCSFVSLGLPYFHNERIIIK